MMASREQQQQHTPAEPTMSELDSLVVSFQTQLSDVMETVLKSAMFQVSRLVEDVFLLEVKRRGQEVDSLRMQLQWTETKLSEEGGRTGKCVDCGREAVELSTEAAERSTDQQEDTVRVTGVKTEVDADATWMLSCREESGSDSSQEEEDHPASIHMNERESQPSENKVVVPVVDMKEEGLEKPSCSVLLGRWGTSLDDESRHEMVTTSEMEDAQPRHTKENNENLLMNVMKQDQQTRSAFGFSEEQQEETSESEEMNSNWTGLAISTSGLQQNQNKRTLHETSVAVQVSSDRDQKCSGSPTVRPQHGDGSGVTVKEEILIDLDGCEENEHTEKERKLSSASLSLKQHRPGSEIRRPMYHRAAVQEVIKLHSKVGAGLRLQAALQHLHRPVKKHPNMVSTGTSAALSASQAVNPHSRVPSTSKAAATPLSLAAQRVQTSQLHRAGAPWISIKAQHHAAHPAPHPDSPAGPRHLLHCGECGKCFPHPSNLKAHLQTHTGERPFCCSLCGRSFTKLSNLKAHRRVHTGERPYCCMACGKRFTQKCNLKRHQRIHLDV